MKDITIEQSVAEEMRYKEWKNCSDSLTIGHLSEKTKEKCNPSSAISIQHDNLDMECGNVNAKNTRKVITSACNKDKGYFFM